MNNNGLIEYKKSFITNIKIFFKMLFDKNNIQYDNREEVANNTVKDKKKDKFVTELKVDSKEVNNVVKKDNFLKEIEGNPERLNMLSIKQLKKLEKYYDTVIEENDRKIKKLKTA